MNFWRTADLSKTLVARREGAGAARPVAPRPAARRPARVAALAGALAAGAALGATAPVAAGENLMTGALYKKNVARVVFGPELVDGDKPGDAKLIRTEFDGRSPLLGTAYLRADTRREGFEKGYALRLYQDGKLVLTTAGTDTFGPDEPPINYVLVKLLPDVKSKYIAGALPIARALAASCPGKHKFDVEVVPQGGKPAAAGSFALDCTKTAGAVKAVVAGLERRAVEDKNVEKAKLEVQAFERYIKPFGGGPCRDGNCNSNGWRVSTPKGAATVTCFNYDCGQYGWAAKLPSGYEAHCSCGADGCRGGADYCS